MVNILTEERYLNVAKEIAIEAGQKSLLAFNQPKQIESKTCAQDLVTATDRAIEELIKSLLKRNFPSHQFIGEETHIMGSGIPDGPTWIVDPIDGTCNFVHGFPNYCISIGLCLAGIPVVGVIYNPVTRELFSAAVGHGAQLNDQPIKITNKSITLSSSLLITEFANNFDSQKTADAVYKLMQHVHGIRMMGSAAMNLSYASCGRVDGYFQKGIKCWDICAGVIIYREAGGYVTDYEGNESFDLYKGEIIAVPSKEFAKEVINTIKS